MIHKQNENYLMENQNSVNLNTGEYLISLLFEGGLEVLKWCPAHQGQYPLSLHLLYQRLFSQDLYRKWGLLN